MITNYNELSEYLSFKNFNEDRNTEFKKGLVWNELKYKITKTILALSNLQDGGLIIIGVDENENGRFTLNGMNKEDSATFKIDDIMSFVNEYADPPVEISLKEIIELEKYFILIYVTEFHQQPVICKKDYMDYLKRGKMYYRPKNKTESTDNFSHHDMRELIELATEKYHSIQLKSCEKFKNAEFKEEHDEEAKKIFDAEVKDF